MNHRQDERILYVTLCVIHVANAESVGPQNQGCHKTTYSESIIMVHSIINAKLDITIAFGAKFVKLRTTKICTFLKT